MKKIYANSFTLPVSLHYDLLIPKNIKQEMPLLIALHGYGENKETLTDLLKTNLTEDCVSAVLQAPFPHIVSPVIPGKPIKYGFGWITSFNPTEAIEMHHKAISHIICEVKGRNNLKITRVLLFGFSQSVALNFRYLFSHPGIIDGVVAVCGGIPGDWNESKKYNSSPAHVLYISCDKDMYYPPKTILRNIDLIRPFCSSISHHIYQNKHMIPLDSFEEINRFVKKVDKNLAVL